MLQRTGPDCAHGAGRDDGGAGGAGRADCAAGGAGYRVVYAIASPATFVTPGGPLDTELHRRGETVYAPDRATPLHPVPLSHGASSLLPDAERPCYLWTIDLDAAGAVTSAHVERALVRSHARLSYAQVQAALDDGACLPAPVPADLPALLSEVGRLREQQEALRGDISLSVPAQEVTRTPTDAAAGSGGTVGSASTAGTEPGYRLTYRAALPVERWNAQVSLLTGMCAARLMVRAGAGILRTMPPAEPRDLRRVRRVARALDVDWPEDLPYPDLVRSLDPGVPAQVAFMDQAAGLFRGAGYLAFGPGCAPAPTGQEAVHAAIAARYAHVTAPLRRLVDRYGEEVCVAARPAAALPTRCPAAVGPHGSGPHLLPRAAGPRGPVGG
ncbi:MULTISPECIES: ribonuclease catalytic domain-containing protein [unclassified Actinomyces]|uniref:ribonuclease catalytic domain-containing protein n=1 Tax=unclassified Actinomyces TaxID=2609248 RepID=UPI002017D8D2|nr:MULTISPECIES: RNB domain-containing ribonuclease [unclassified Actinomyces]